jgi:hypothetical protein
VTSFGGLILPERLAGRLGLWRTLAGLLPARRGGYDWPAAIKAMTMGLLSGAQGTCATQALREDAALLKLLSLHGAPEEATAWRMLQGLGQLDARGALGHAQAILARRALEKMARPDLLLDGFVPVFADGTLLEGSAAREGTKHLREKGRGLMWSTVFVGPLLAPVRGVAGQAPAGGAALEAPGRNAVELHRRADQPARKRCAGHDGGGGGPSRRRSGVSTTPRPGWRRSSRTGFATWGCTIRPAASTCATGGFTPWGRWRGRWAWPRTCWAARAKGAAAQRAGTAQLLGLGEARRQLFERYWGHICRC